MRVVELRRQLMLFSCGTFNGVRYEFKSSALAKVKWVKKKHISLFTNVNGVQREEKRGRSRVVLLRRLILDEVHVIFDFHQRIAHLRRDDGEIIMRHNMDVYHCMQCTV